MQARLQRIQDLFGVPVVRSGNADGVEIFTGQHVAIVFVLGGLVPVFLMNVVCHLLALHGPDFGDSGQFHIASCIAERRQRLHMGSKAPTSGTDHPDANALVAAGRSRRDRWQRGDHSTGSSGKARRSQKITAVDGL